MKVGRKSFLLTFALVALALAGGSSAFAQNQSPTPCNATGPDYSPDFSLNQACLYLNGENNNSASTAYPSFQPPIAPAPPNVSNVLRLTPNVQYQGGSAWFQTPQPVSSPFTTTFTFQLSPNVGNGADGIAFLIQNSGLTALGPTACGEGFAGDVPSPAGCTPIPENTITQTGIASSIAFRFNSHSQGVGGGTQTNDPGVNNVSIQSCPGMAPNSITAACQLAVYPFLQIDFADGNVHTVIITYVLTPSASQTACTVNDAPSPCLDVNLDGTDLFPTGVPFDMTTLGLTSGTAYVGFTGATGSLTDNQDILSWVFTPQGQTQTLQPGVPATYNFQNPQGQTAYTYQATLSNNSSPTTTTVTPIYPNTPSYPYTCDTLIQQTYPGAHCVVYTDLGTGVSDSPVMFEVTCPNLPQDQCNPFSASLGTSYTLSPNNSLNSCINTNSCTGQPNAPDPFPGWVKFAGPDSTHPCTPPQSGTLVQSNQISGFIVDTITRGGSGGTGSCWIATYDMPQCTSPGQQNCEALPGISIAAPTNGLIVAAGSTVPTSYSCSNPTSSQSSTSSVGPYLTTASCTQSIGTGSCTQSASGLSCTGSFTAPSQAGTYQFTVTGTDSGENGTTQTVSYTVVAPTNLQILNLGPPGPIANGGYIEYAIGVADLGPANADGVVVTDALPSNTTFVSGSGSNVSCGIVNKKLSCSTTPIQCSATGGTVTCSVGTLAPLSISDLNGGAMTIKVQVTAEPTTTCGTKPCTINTATVSAINTDTNSNPSSTVKTTW
jgi:uncharacterized repeat protein (TIGR01451 family)